ncbi:nitrophenyl compound nitroreductase subunit ArsF family protein [Sunxiuqinia sp. A32]|uniref:nitrophenyl compound nitroreductase subunit ArsF family protein n=1 Tax=Sunxiuqinia sp. A32 TaxID=3461496 RepID=UPI0040468896
MKKLISITIFIFAISVFNVNAQCCDKSSIAVKTKKCCSDTKETSEVKAYYFHGTRRCVTCEAVESVTRDALKELYADKVTFDSINREEDNENALVKKYKISGQTLIIVKGEKVVNLTNDAFMNARTKPEKLKAKIKSTVDDLI